ncbi:MAG: N-acetylglucosamine-6-phosphate deacetylase [Clostridiales bacterium]|nr:N-acetylglucosamine-6-phosphate deacetylase [Clostridiales bacterium]
MILYKNGYALIDGKLVQTDIVANHGRIIEIAPDIVADDETEVVDCTRRYVLPALVDIHTHGAVGYDFNTADADGMKKILDFYISHGVGTVFPTVMTDTDEVICRQVALIAEIAKDYPEIKGIHLEGPFLSREFCGAMPVELLQKPSMDKFLTYQKAAEGKIKLVTVAPELPDALAFISEVTDQKVVVSIGHSGADGEIVKKALKLGAKSFTHWGNAMSQLDRHNLNVAGAALASDAFCEVICDGKHVDKDVLKLLVKIKGVNKVIGVTDSIMAAGLTDGVFTLAGQSVTVKCGEAFLTGTNTRAGSTLDAYQGLANAVTFTGLPLHEAIKLWTVNPARLVGLHDRIGTIEVGKDADFIIFG